MNAMIREMGTKDWKGGAYEAFWRTEAPEKFPEAMLMFVDRRCLYEMSR